MEMVNIDETGLPGRRHSGGCYPRLPPIATGLKQAPRRRLLLSPVAVAAIGKIGDDSLGGALLLLLSLFPGFHTSFL